MPECDWKVRHTGRFHWGTLSSLSNCLFPDEPHATIRQRCAVDLHLKLVGSRYSMFQKPTICNDQGSRRHPSDLLPQKISEAYQSSQYHNLAAYAALHAMQPSSRTPWQSYGYKALRSPACARDMTIFCLKKSSSIRSSNGSSR